LEGPFICEDKKGAHEESCLQTFNQGMKSFEQIYGVPFSLIFILS